MNLEFRTVDSISAFSTLPWHDSEFLGWSVAYGSDDEAEVTFEIKFCSSEIATGRARVKFHDCRGFFTDVDLLAKRHCSDQIATGYSEDAEESGAEFVKR